jgi:Arylsulfotransferase (ASST)
MKRNRLIVALVVLVALVAAAAVLGGCGGSGSSSGSGSSAQSGVSPACLPSTLEHSASLPGTDLDVSPAPETDTANPATQISFLGVPAARIHMVSVVGERSGSHAGRLEDYSQGDGASFVPDTQFDAGERVLVHAVIPPASASASASQASTSTSTSASGSASASTATSGAGGKQVSFAFRVDTPYPTANVPPYENLPAAPADYESFATMPGVKAPILAVTTSDRDPAAGDVFTTNGPGPGAYGPLIYTPQGRLVWFDQLSGGLTAEDLNVQSYEGRRDLTFWQGKVLSLGFGQGEDVVLNSSYEHVATVKGGNGLKADLHEFQIAPRDVAYVTAYNPIRCNLSSAEGSAKGAIVDVAVQEIDIKTGLVRWEWHSLDHVAVAESETSPPKGVPWDWFHLNSIDLEPDGNVLISARSTWAAYQLEGGSGRILWRLGGLKSSFAMGPGTKTAWQHDARVLPDGEITLFDDGSNPPVHAQSRGLRIRLDLRNHTATLTKAYTHPGAPLLSASQGNMQTLPNGNAVVGYGGVPQISEFSAGGALLLDAHLPYTEAFYRGFRFPWNGHPSSPPAVAANLNNTGEETIVHMSWNGATEVASWRVLAGKDPKSLTPQTTIAAGGFESSTILAKKYAYAAVQALDSAGRVLGTSPAARVGSFESALPGTGG